MPAWAQDRELTKTVHCKVSVQGTGGVSATVFVMVQQGQVWMSIQPPFTWEAIMDPAKVDELIGTFTRAREEVKRVNNGRRDAAIPISVASKSRRDAR